MSRPDARPRSFTVSTARASGSYTDPGVWNKGPAGRGVAGDRLTGTFAHLQRIANAQTPEEIWALHLDLMAGYGFDRVAYGFTRWRRENSIGDSQDAFYLSNHDRTDPGFDLAFFMRTPMFRWAAQNTGACSWRWAEEQRAAGLLSADEVAAMDAARRAGFCAGYTISFPEHSPRAKGAMGLTARAGLTQTDVEAIWAAEGEAIHALCTTMHLRITHMPFRVARRPLSARQREALEWVAEGKTTQDIATIMGISAAAVEKHLRLARIALDVETTAHAVAKAAMMNHIFAAPDTAMCPVQPAASGRDSTGGGAAAGGRYGIPH
jgi:LuxR family transcriptional regulator